jgi:L-fuconolactonase
VIIDAHFHCWRLDRGDYGWLTPALTPIYRDVSVADWARESRPCGVTGGVLVQAAPTAAETEFLIETATARDDVPGVVGWTDLLASDASCTIVRLASAHRKLKGLRPMLQDIADPDWILQRALAPALDAMVECGLAFDALVKSAHLPRILELCVRHPALRVVIDHAAKPDIAGDHWEPWASDLQRIARETNAVCKLSGLFTESGARPVRRWAQQVIDAFGPERVLWGSDWPVLELAADYRAWWDEVQPLLAPLGAAQRAAVLGSNARRVYRL